MNSKQWHEAEDQPAVTIEEQFNPNEDDLPVKPIRAGALTMEHIGQTITAQHGGTTLTGMLASVHHQADIITDGPTMMSRTGLPDHYMIGRSQTVVRIAPDLRLELDPSSTVEVTA